jgi:hypothetical protein
MELIAASVEANQQALRFAEELNNGTTRIDVNLRNIAQLWRGYEQNLIDWARLQQEVRKGLRRRFRTLQVMMAVVGNTNLVIELAQVGRQAVTALRQQVPAWNGLAVRWVTQAEQVTPEYKQAKRTFRRMTEDPSTKACQAYRVLGTFRAWIEMEVQWRD